MYGTGCVCSQWTASALTGASDSSVSVCDATRVTAEQQEELISVINTMGIKEKVSCYKCIQGFSQGRLDTDICISNIC